MSASLQEALPEYIWRTRYRDPEARPGERSIEDTWQRVARAIAAIEPDQATWQDRFARLLHGYRFLPAGRILAGAGVAREVTLFNCFVMGTIDDSIPGIFEALKEGALTMQQGGGVGYDFSTLRPRGSHARTTGALASGPVSFMRVWDAMCATVLSTGTRRGAMMATLRCDHPDIEEFIDSKSTPESLRHFNISVLVSDAFLRAVARDEDWPLVFPEGTLRVPDGSERTERPWSGTAEPVPCRIWRRVRARGLWTHLCANAEQYAEPGVLFIDRINAENNLAYAEALSATNPCAEEPLPPYGACNLGSINLTAFVSAPFTASARIDREAIADATRTAVRFLDDVIDVSRFPLFRQRTQAHRSRRIGIGITGLADALAMLGLRYDSDEARSVAAATMCAIRDAAYAASVDLARERGTFELFDPDAYAERPFIRRLPADIQSGIRRDGIRNSHLLAVAPAGTISLLAGNVSSGIEPIFRLDAERRVIDADGSFRRFEVSDGAYTLWRAQALQGAPVPECFVDQSEISARDHVLMQAALQPFVDGSISKTVALAANAPSGTAREIFDSAYALGLKGCTVFRETARPGVLQETAAQSERNAHCCDLQREAD